MTPTPRKLSQVRLLRRELRKYKAELRDLSNAISTFLLLNKTKSATEMLERIVDDLRRANDRARRFALGGKKR